MLYELHTHSTFSDGDADPLDIVKYAKRIGLDGVAITDHDEIEGSLAAADADIEGIDVIAGMEVGSKQGHILGLDIREIVPKGLSAKETIELIHGQGGIAIAAHPYDTYRRGVGDLILKHPFDAVEVANGHTFANKRDPEAICRQAGLPMVGGSDAHALEEVGSVIVEFEGNWRQALAEDKMTVRSRPKSELIVNNLRRISRRGGLLGRIGKMAKKRMTL